MDLSLPGPQCQHIVVPYVFYEVELLQPDGTTKKGFYTHQANCIKCPAMFKFPPPVSLPKPESN